MLTLVKRQNVSKTRSTYPQFPFVGYVNAFVTRNGAQEKQSLRSSWNSILSQISQSSIHARGDDC